MSYWYTFTPTLYWLEYYSYLLIKIKEVRIET